MTFAYELSYENSGFILITPHPLSSRRSAIQTIVMLLFVGRQSVGKQSHTS